MKPWTPKRIIIWVVGISIAIWAISPYFFSKESNETLEDLIGDAKLVDMKDVSIEKEGSEADKQENEKLMKQKSNDVVQNEDQIQEEVAEVEVKFKKEEVVQMPTEDVAMLAGMGEFEGLARHNAEGIAKLIKVGDKYFVRFEDNFSVTNGPDLFVDLGFDGKHDGSARLGKLKGSVGGQNYEVPAGINIEDYNEVWVWCRAFSVPFGKALLR